MATTFRRERLKWMAVAANNHLHRPAEKDNAPNTATSLWVLPTNDQQIGGKCEGKSSQRFPIRLH